MYGESNGHWRDDVKWIAAVVATVATAITLLYVGAAQLSTEARGRPLLERALTLTLAPDGESAPDVREGIDYEAGDPLEPLAGVAVVADATEIPTLTTDDALGRIAGVLSDTFVSGGTPALLEQVNDTALREQLDVALSGPIPVLLDRHLRARMLPSGLDDGSRLADWPLQAQRNPGEPVQPIVGVFVYAEPSELASLTPREIGELVVGRLGDLVLEGGLPAALEVITNDNLAARLRTAVESDTRATLHETFTALLAARRGQIDARLEQARAILEAQGETPTGIAGVLSPDQLAGLSDDARRQRVIEALAERAYTDGAAALVPLLQDAAQADRVASVVGLLDTMTRDARGAFLRRAWVYGIVAGLFLLILIAASRGWGRMVNPGMSLALAAAGGAGGFWALVRALGPSTAAELPLSVQSEGAFAHLAGLLGYLVHQVPRDALDLLLLDHLIVLGVGAGLVVLALSIRLMRALRPRRRSLL